MSIWMNWIRMKTGPLLFYDLLTGLSDEYLEESGYTREEVTEGVTAAASRYGYERFAQELMEGDWDK